VIIDVMTGCFGFSFFLGVFMFFFIFFIIFLDSWRFHVLEIPHRITDLDGQLGVLLRLFFEKVFFCG
jgi:hypothetical protein